MHEKESDVQHAILDYLHMKGIMAWRNNNMGVYRKNLDRWLPAPALGAPDIYAVHEGTFYGIEVKGTGGKLSEHQKEFGDRLVKAGAVFLVARSLDDVMAVFR